MITILVLVLTVIIIGIAGAITLTVVSKLGLGLEVDGFGSAFKATLVIGVVSALVHWLTGVIGLPGGAVHWLAIIINLTVAAVILMISDKFVKGMKVSGFIGGFVAAFSIAVISGVTHLLMALI